MGYSVLGRLIKKRVKDVHYAEGIYIFSFATLLIGLIIFNYLGWALIQPALASANGEQVAVAFWIAQTALAALFVLFCVIGFKPATQITVDTASGLSIKQGKTQLNIRHSDIESVTSLSALRFHRHYRKYQNTRIFFGRLPRLVMLISTSEFPIVLGLSPEDHRELLTHLQPQPQKIVFPSVTV